MKKTAFYFVTALCCLVMAGCQESKNNPNVSEADTIEIADPDTTIYGTCGPNTTMHNIELVTDNGTALTMLVNITTDDEGNETGNAVKGGLFSGDRLAVISSVADGDTIAMKVINLNTLKGKWTSIDRNFEILDDGDVISTVQSEKNPSSSWNIHNGMLLLGRDTFNVLTLGADTLELESKRGIYVYRRLIK